MPRALTLGNGDILVTLDERGQVRDFYFPYVGLENHIGGHFFHRVGIFVDGTLSWTGDGDWQVTVDSEPDVLAGRISAKNERLGVSLFFGDLVYNEKNIFIRKIEIKNLADRPRPIKIFFAHQFELYESHIAHTAYFDPAARVMIHYRNRRAFLINAHLAGRGFTEYTTGIFGTEGREGSHLDAADGVLAKNPIEHGQADSVIGLEANYAAGEEQTVYYWLTVGKSVAEAASLNDYVLAHGVGHLIETTKNYWHAWVFRRNFNFHGLDERVVGLFNKSLLIIRAHADNDGGIIASSDSDVLQHGRDTYSYVWPRDAAFAALALARAGDINLAKKFFAFCRAALGDGEYFMHKYSPDGSLGSSWHPWVKDEKPCLPIQEDETALVIYALWQYYLISKDLEFVEEVYNSLIKKTGDFMVLYRDEKTGLPRSSYELWEESFGTSTFTASAVYGALLAASNFARILGKVKTEYLYRKTAEEVKAGILRYLYDEQRNVFYKLLNWGSDGNLIRDPTIDASSAFGVFVFGVLPPEDTRLTHAMLNTESALRSGKIGGLARYGGDAYYRLDNSYPGNPWVLTTLWWAQYEIARAKTEADLVRVRDRYFKWAVDHASVSGILAEQLNPWTGFSLSVAPLVWSHAAFVNAVIKYLDKLEELGVCQACNPVY